MSPSNVHRILIVDDNLAIHEDFRKILGEESAESTRINHLESRFFGGETPPKSTSGFELDFASQGREGLEKLQVALATNRPYALAFVDMRMPPGWDGVETIKHLWNADPELQVVICTAYTDHSWEDFRAELGTSDNLLVLKKPFDIVEALQIAHALTRKWELARKVRLHINELDRKVIDRTRSLDREMAGRAQAEENLRQVQKVESVGQLSAGIAHDFNNLLTVIRGHVSMISTPGGAVNLAHSLNQIAVAADRAATLTRQLLVFSRKEAECFKPLDLNSVVSNTCKLLREVIGEHIELRLQLTDAPARLVADESNLDQIIMNLVINARDAMPDGGRVTLRTSIEELDGDAVAHRPLARPGRFVRLTVTDTGCGMDAATLARIFEPFYTTKEAGKGTGLGLATVYGIVQRHDGWIEVDSRPGQGTTFRVYFPFREGPKSVLAPAKFPGAQSDLKHDKVTIMVVEDEPDVRDFATTVLRMNSYQVVEARDGVDALGVWSRCAGRVDVLFTDMVMPNGLSGRGLSEKLCHESSLLKVIQTSGYSPETIGVKAANKPGFNFLPKPYTADSLLRAISDLLALNGSKRAA